jgi:hypothetical protein
MLPFLRPEVARQMGAARSSERSDPAEEQPTGKRGEAASKADRSALPPAAFRALGR